MTVAPLPEDWHELEEVPLIVEKYRAHDPGFAVHEDRDLAVQVVPDEPNVAHGDQSWAVELVRGTPSNAERVAVVREVEERSEALEFAREVMREVNRRLDRNGAVNVGETANELG